MIEANHTSWVDVSADSDFPIQNLPFGIFSTADRSARAGVAIGEHILDLQAVAEMGLLDGLGAEREDFAGATLNAFIDRGKAVTRAVRGRVSELLREGSELAAESAAVLVRQSDAMMHLPVHIGDYTDFYSSEDHARNVGKMFRDPDNALLPNWKHIPVGYHGRASSIVVSGTPIKRPHGQTRPDDAEPPVFGPSRLLDFELEMAFVTHPGKPLGETISTDEAEDYIFGLALFNDWSARDIQKWEYVPLGPFLGKNFGSSMSPWIVMLDVLEPYRVPGPVQDPPVLPYLEYSGDAHYDVAIEVEIIPKNGQGQTVTRSNFKHMYWNMRQQLAHHAVNGCNIRGGDVMASGTISGPVPGSFGSMLEISWRGKPFFIAVHGYDITTEFKDEDYKSQFVALANNPNCRGVVCASHYTKRLCVLAGVDSGKCEVIRLGLDGDLIKRDETIEKTAHASFVHFGRLTEKKHPIATLEAFKLVAAKIPDATLTFIGEGPLKPELLQRIEGSAVKDRVRCLGAMERAEALKEVQRHWVFVQHSVTAKSGDQEGFALSPAEAALMEMPVVSTRHNGIPEHVIDGKTGFLVNEFDFESMAERMVELARDESLRAKFGQFG